MSLTKSKLELIRGFARSDSAETQSGAHGNWIGGGNGSEQSLECGAVPGCAVHHAVPNVQIAQQQEGPEVSSHPSGGRCALTRIDQMRAAGLKECSSVERTHHHVVTVRVPKGELSRACRRIRLWLGFEPRDKFSRA